MSGGWGKVRGGRGTPSVATFAKEDAGAMMYHPGKVWFLHRRAVFCRLVDFVMKVA